MFSYSGTFSFQEDSSFTESRPGTAHTATQLDPLDVDVEDLYVKYKVYCLILHVPRKNINIIYL